MITAQTTLAAILRSLRRTHRRTIITEAVRLAALVVHAAAAGWIMGYFIWRSTL